MKTVLRIIAVLTVVLISVIAISSTALAKAPDVVGPGDGSTPFLCPAVNAAVPHAHALGDSGFYTFLPGHNQAGAHANPHAYNGVSASESQGPVLDEYWSPIWPSDAPQP